MDQHILIVGELSEGLSFIGPFDDAAEAAEYADFTLREPWWVAPLDPKPAPVKGTVEKPFMRGRKVEDVFLDDPPVTSFTGSAAPEYDDAPRAIYISEHPEDTGEVLVTIWNDDVAEIAYREHSRDVWSPPLTMERRETR